MANQSVSSSVYSPHRSGVLRPDSSVERVALSGESWYSVSWLAQVPGSTPGRVSANYIFFSPTRASHAAPTESMMGG